MNKKIVIVLFTLVAVACSYYYPKVAIMLNTATGFSAKNVCSGYFISGFSVQSIIDEALVPVDSAFSFISVNANEQEQNIETSFFGLFSRKAVYSSGIGCTLLAIGESDLNRTVKPLEFTHEKSKNLAWPKGNGAVNSQMNGIDYAKLSIALRQAFTEPKLAQQGGISRRTKAVAVIYQGQLVAEQYATDVDKNTPLLSWSMAKSVTNLQVGLLVNDGLLDINKPANVPNWQSKLGHQKITVDQLLRMSSGLEFAENYGGASDAPYMLSVAPSASDFAENKPMAHQPDTFWAYSSGTSNILSAIVKRTIGGDFQQYYDYTQRKLFQPLNIKTMELEVDSKGTFIGSSYIYATARDWAKLGQLMLQDGVWHDERILPQGWVQYSTTPTKTDALNHYGAQFWLNADPIDESKQRTWPTVPSDTYSMNGYQGQYVVSIPSKELVVVRFGFTSPGADRGIEQLLSGVIAAIN